MFTSEELEECDIFPKKITLNCGLKFLFYLLAMTLGCILIYSFYSGQEFISIITFESLNYGRQSYLTDRLYEYDSNYNYDIKQKYYINYENVTSDRIILDYIGESFPCVITNSSHVLDFYQNLQTKGKDYLIENFQNETLYVETRQDPSMVFFKRGYTWEAMSYGKFYEEGSREGRLQNYFLNEYPINNKSLYFDLIKSLRKLHFVEHLDFEQATYSEGFDEILIPGHYDKTENLLCMIKGGIDMMIIPHLQRSNMYPYKKEYGPINYSAVPFFKGDYGRFPNFKKVHRVFVSVSDGECIYVPSYWWQSIRTYENKHYIFVTFKFASASRWFDNIVSSIESEEI